MPFAGLMSDLTLKSPFTITRNIQRGTIDPPNKSVFQMFPEYAGQRLLQSNLASNCSSRAVSFIVANVGPYA